ncbi:MAG TPA: hypothetical protein VIL30_09645 [Ramlibacter sp.]|jgi:hypothetical protein
MRPPARLLACLLVAAAALLGAGCSGSGEYTLYRNSALDAKMRIHLATFNAAEGNDYNSENCEIAARMFMGQPGVKVAYWCEKGSYRK